MIFSFVLSVFITISCAAPVQENEKRLFNGLLGSAAGLLGIESTYDYVIVGA